MRRKQRLAALSAAILSLSLAACAQKPQAASGEALESGIAAIEDTMKQKNETASANSGDLRSGTSADTVATPADFPAAYNYGTGRIRDYSRSMMLKKLPRPNGNETVLNTPADPNQIQVLYLWEEGKAPAKTQFTQNMSGYFDDWDFRPYVTAIPVPEGVTPKGAVVMMAGGAYQFRGNYTDSLPHCGSSAGRRIPDLYRGLPPVSLYPGGGGAGRSPCGAVCSEKCGSLWY